MHTTGMAGGYDYHTALHNGLLMDKAIIFLYNIVLGNGNNSFFVQKVLSNLLYILQTDPPHPAERWGGYNCHTNLARIALANSTREKGRPAMPETRSNGIVIVQGGRV